MYHPTSRSLGSDKTTPTTSALDGSTFLRSNTTISTSSTTSIHDNNTTHHGTHIERNLKRNSGQVVSLYGRSNNVSFGGQGLGEGQGQGLAGGGGGGGEEDPRRRKLPIISTRVKMRENLFPAADGPCAYFAERRVKLYHSLGDDSLFSLWIQPLDTLTYTTIHPHTLIHFLISDTSCKL